MVNGEWAARGTSLLLTINHLPLIINHLPLTTNH